MDRKRKGYLLRKSVTFNVPQKQPPRVACTCDINSKTYDLQTQTLTFGEEPKQHNTKRFSAGAILRKLTHSSATQHKSVEVMDSDLEFYPVEDGPSPSTFTAWDAFMSGNQAFFREPPYAAMDVIPEEEDDLEALIESDTDDTGSSVSTVVERFATNSFADSFDLEKVLSPFERLEKEFDAHQGSKDDDGRRRTEMPSQGPIVVITNSSSCEDVHSAEEDSYTNSSNQVSRLHKMTNTSEDDKASNVASTNGVSYVPPKSKVVNGHRTTNKSNAPTKKVKSSDKAIPVILPPPVSSRKRRTYPTPCVPPRMSSHVTVRRNKSDPEQPSRIPRPIANRSGKSNCKKNANSNNLKKNTAPDVAQTNTFAEETISESKDASVDTSSRNVTEIKETETKEGVQSMENVNSKEKTNLNCYSDSEILEECLSGQDEMTFSTAEYESTETLETSHHTETFNQQNDTFSDEFSNTFFEEKSSSTVEVAETSAFTSYSQNNEAGLLTDLSPPPIPERSSLRTKSDLKISSISNETDLLLKESSSRLDSDKNLVTLPEASDETYLNFQMSNIDSTSQSIWRNDIPVNSNCEWSAFEDTPSSLKFASDEVHMASKNSNISKTTWSAFGDTTTNIKSEIDQPVLVTTENGNLDEDVELFFNDIPFISKTELDMTYKNGNIDEIFTSKTVATEVIENGTSSGTSEEIPHRPIEDILEALDQLVLSNCLPPKDLEINIDWGSPGSVNIREKEVLSPTSGDGSETDGLTEERHKSIENLLKEVDECLQHHNGKEFGPSETAEKEVIRQDRTPLSPGNFDVPTAGSTDPPRQAQDVAQAEVHIAPDMLRHQDQDFLSSNLHHRTYAPPYLESIEALVQDPKHHSLGCDDSGVFLEDPVVSSPETPAKSTSRLKNMRQYALPQEVLDSDAEKSDDLGLASSSIDSADDLDGDPLPSSLQICPPPPPTRQKPPPVPARKLPPSIKTELSTNISLELPSSKKMSLSKRSSSGEDSNFGEGDFFPMDDNEDNKNIVLTPQKNGFSITHIDSTLKLQTDSSYRYPESKSDSANRVMSSKKSESQLDRHSLKVSDNVSAFKWKSEECLKTVNDNKWSLLGRRYEKSVSVKDRIAMFSEMEANHNPVKKDLQRYGSENNIKAAIICSETKNTDVPATNSRKYNSLSNNSKWQSMNNIDKRYSEKEIAHRSYHMTPALSIPSLPSNLNADTVSNHTSVPFPIKLDIEAPKPIISTYPETQLTNNKRYNYGLYSLKNLKNTEDLLSKKASGTNLLSIIDSRRQPVRKLKGLVIPEKPLTADDSSKALPTILSNSDSDTTSNDNRRRASLPITVVTASNSLPRNKKLECPPTKQPSLAEPPWKSERTSSNTLPKYSPAFKKRSLELLAGSSLSPTPPSSLTSPLSPPPSSPSSVCSSNASSSLQQNVFQFSLSHSKPVQPLQPEKALLSPPPRPPSDMEYEGDNSEDSSHSASPMRNIESKEIKVSNQSQTPGLLHYGKSNTFTSCATPVTLQPLLVETLSKNYVASQPRAATCITKTEIHLRTPVNNLHDKAQVESLPKTQPPEIVPETTYNKNTVAEFVKNERKGVIDVPHKNSNGVSIADKTSPQSSDYLNNYINNRKHSVTNGTLEHTSHITNSQHLEQNSTTDSNSVKKFKAAPLNLVSTKHLSSNGQQRSLVTSEYDESDDDSHSTLSHRTEDSRHTTTDDCLSDATTDSFEKARFNVSSVKSTVDDYASTEGYLSDASTDISLRRFPQHRPTSDMYSAEEYLSDATAESLDPDWTMNKTPSKNSPRALRKAVESTPDLRPKHLSLQKTVLRTSAEPSGSVEKFRALAEKWEQRADVTSPPPLLQRNSENKLNSAFLTGSTTIKGKINNGLPPSLMPRNVSERKSTAHTRSTELSESNGWAQDRIKSNSRRDSSSNDTLKEEKDGYLAEHSSNATYSNQEIKDNSRLSKSNCSLKSSTSVDSAWNNEPRNRRGADFSRTEWSTSKSASLANNKATVSDIRRSFENEDKPPLPKKPAIIATIPPSSSVEEEALVSLGKQQLQSEGGDQWSVVAVTLHREGSEGGSVGITLAGGADYEVKEITVHKVIRGSIADRDGRVLKGDRVLSINGRDVRGVSHGEALHILKAPNPKVLLVLARDQGISSPNIKQEDPKRQATKDADTFIVELQKDSTGLGFSIEGGKDSPQGDRPLLIKRVFKGGAAEKEGQLEEGDEILFVNTQSVTHMTRTEAWNFLKKLPEGPVHLQTKKNSSYS